MVFLFLLGRILCGGFFIYNGVNHLKNLDGMIAYSKVKNVPQPKAGVLISGALMILGGLSMVLGVKMVIGMILILVALVPITLFMHRFWKEKDRQAKMMERTQFLKNTALIGALCMMIALAYLFFR